MDHLISSVDQGIEIDADRFVLCGWPKTHGVFLVPDPCFTSISGSSLEQAVIVVVVRHLQIREFFVPYRLAQHVTVVRSSCSMHSIRLGPWV
jgi:hypothetical protein